MPRQRKRTRDRVGSGVVITCPCGQRLADLFETDAGKVADPREVATRPLRGLRDVLVDGVRFVHFQEADRDFTGGARNGIKNIAEESWSRVVCSKPGCKKDHQGREPDLFLLVRYASSLGLRTISIDRRLEVRRFWIDQVAGEKPDYTPSRAW